MQIALVIIGCALLLLLGLAVQQIRTRQHSVFVIPKGFQGAIRIESFVPNGAVVPSIDGEQTFFVPTNGTLQLGGAGPFARYATYSARWSDGSPLATGDARTNDDPDGTALWVLFSQPDHVMWFYVGPHREYLSAVSDGARSLTPAKKYLANP